VKRLSKKEKEIIERKCSDYFESLVTSGKIQRYIFSSNPISNKNSHINGYQQDDLIQEIRWYLYKAVRSQVRREEIYNIPNYMNDLIQKAIPKLLKDIIRKEEREKDFDKVVDTRVGYDTFSNESAFDNLDSNFTPLERDIIFEIHNDNNQIEATQENNDYFKVIGKKRNENRLSYYKLGRVGISRKLGITVKCFDWNYISAKKKMLAKKLEGYNNEE